MRQIRATPQGEPQAILQVKERDSAVLELGANDPVRGKSQAVAIERNCALEVVHAESQYGDPGFHCKRFLRWRRDECARGKFTSSATRCPFTRKPRHSLV